MKETKVDIAPTDKTGIYLSSFLYPAFRPNKLYVKVKFDKPEMFGGKIGDYYIKEVIYNDPATIVFWNDGTKTVAKCHNDTYNREVGLMVAVLKKVGGKDFLKKMLADWLPEDTKITHLSLKDVRKNHRKDTK